MVNERCKQYKIVCISRERVDVNMAFVNLCIYSDIHKQTHT